MADDKYTELVEQTVQAHIEMTGQVPTLTEHLEIQMVVSEECNK
jgi:hypothetical protein